MFAVHCLEIKAEAITPLELNTYSGSALRGAFFRAIWGRFCTNRESPTCSVCPLVSACPVAELVAPLRDESIYGRDTPRPYLISSEYRELNRYEQGETFTFNFSLIGSSVKLFPYIIRSFQEMERNTLGHPLAELGGRRGQFSIRQVKAYHPFTGERQVLWERESLQPQKPRLEVTSKDVFVRAEQLPADQLTLHFLSPTRLIYDERLVKHPNFQVLVLRLAERFRRLQEEYSDNTGNTRNDEKGAILNHHELFQHIGSQAGTICLVKDETRWIDVESYSTRVRKSSPIGGFIGRASYTGDLTFLRELLVWGEVLHVGKNVVKGNGLYRIES